MKAIRVHRPGGPDVMKLEEIDDPTPGPGQIVVRVRAAGVNPVDTYIRSGNYARMPALPYTPGNDVAGVVQAVGAGVRTVAVGDRVYVSGVMLGGGYAELALCGADSVRPLPANVGFSQGAAVNVAYGTAYQSLFHKAQAMPGETVLVHGASGGVGIAAVQLAVAAGMTVIGTAGSERGRELVRSQGARHVLDHGSADYTDAIMTLTGGRGVDVVMEMLANVNLAKDLALIALRGRIVVIGNRGTTEINARMAMNKDAAILGMALFHASPAELHGIHAALVEGLANGTLSPVIAQELPLAQASRGHEAVMEPGHHGKIVLVP
jgi:NADPH2:quinone reductase